MNWKPINQYRDKHFTDDEREGLALFDRWAEGKGIVRYALGVSGLDWIRIIQTGRLAYLTGDPDDPPGLDHPVLFRSAAGLVWLAYQPYERPEDIRNEAEAWAGERGLFAEVHEQKGSWYTPGDTCLVVVTRKGVMGQ